MSSARKIVTVLLCLSAESVAWAQAPDAGGLSPGWFVATKHEGQYAVEASASGVCGGRAAIARSLLPSVSGTVSVMQLFRAEKYRNSRVRFSATLDTSEVTGWAGLWMRVDGPEKKTLSFDNMQNRAMQGTHHCEKASVVLDVPSYAETIALGLVLNGGGRAELGNLSIETVDTTVPTTNLAPPPELPVVVTDAGVAAPLATSRGDDPLSDEKLGRVGAVWFSDRVIVEHAYGKVRVGSGKLHLVAPDSWSDGVGDYTANRRGERIVVKGLDPSIGMLTTMTGELTMRREGDTTIIEGSWGGQKKYPVSIRLSRKRLDMTWGFYERHLIAEASPQAPPECVYFSRRSAGLAVPPSDALQVCGVVFDAGAPPVQTVMAFLMTGFHRFDGN